jgi:hypothetical protein
MIPIHIRDGDSKEQWVPGVGGRKDELVKDRGFLGQGNYSV